MLNLIPTPNFAEINEAKAYMKKCGPKNSNIIFIEDRVKNAYSADGSVKKTFESYSVTNCQNEFGHYTDFPLHLEASGFSASAPKPYTVSVGNATKPPSLMMRAADRIFSVSIWFSSTFSTIVFISLFYTITIGLVNTRDSQFHAKLQILLNFCSNTA